MGDKKKSTLGAGSRGGVGNPASLLFREELGLQEKPS